jgi:hypothetical protein
MNTEVEQTTQVVPPSLIEETTLQIMVVDEASRIAAADMVTDLKARRKRIVNYWKPAKQQADKAKQALLDNEDAMLAPVDAAIKDLDGKIKVYVLDVNKKEREAQAKADADARQKTKEKREADQEKAIEAGQIEQAIELESKPLPKPAPAVVVPMAAKTVKTSTSTATAKPTVKFEISDLNAFFKYCAEHDRCDLWDVRLGAVKTWVKNSGLVEVPGLTITDDIATAYRPNK